MVAVVGMLTILYGPDAALVEQYVSEHFAHMTVVRGVEALAERLDGVRGGDLFGAKKGIVVYGCRCLTNATVKAEAELLGTLGLTPADDVVLAGVGDRLITTGPVGKLAKLASVKKATSLSEKALAAKAAEYAASLGIKLTPATLALLAERLPSSWGVYRTELHKLALLGGSQTLAGGLISTYGDSDIFGWCRKLAAGDACSAWSGYQKLLGDGHADGEILAILSGQLFFMRAARLQWEKTPNVSAVARFLGVPDFRVAGSFDVIGSVTSDRLGLLLDRLHELDMASKQGALDRELIVRTLIISP